METLDAVGNIPPAEELGAGATTSGKVLTAQGAHAAPVWADPAGGALSFEDLTDVDMTGVADGDVPTWDDGTSTWLPGSGGGGGVTLATIDLPPASPNSKDEEFDSTTLPSWTFVASSGTPTNGDISLFDRANPTNPSWNADDQVPSTLLMQPKAGTFFKAYRSFAPTSGTRWAIIAKVYLGNRDAGEDGAGINVYKETPGTSNYYPTDGVLLEVYSGVASSFRVNGGSASGRSTSSQGNRSSWYLAISSRTDNSIDTWCSKDGIAWEWLANYSGLNINGAVANAVIHVRDSTGSVPAYAALGWIRFLEGSNTLFDAIGFPSGGDMTLDMIGDVVITSPADGDVLAYDSGSGDWVNAAPSGGSTLIASSTVTGSVAASIDFSGIPNTYSHLELIVQLASDSATNPSGILLRMNNDSGSNYNWGYKEEPGGANGTQDGDTSANVGDLPGTTTTAAAGMTRVFIPNYAGTTWRKQFSAYGAAYTTDAGGGMIGTIRSCVWKSTSAITRLTLLPGAGNFAIGSTAHLYGWT